jgi:hypothetical protein
VGGWVCPRQFIRLSVLCLCVCVMRTAHVHRRANESHTRTCPHTGRVWDYVEDLFVHSMSCLTEDGGRGAGGAAQGEGQQPAPMGKDQGKLAGGWVGGVGRAWVGGRWETLW